MAKIMIVEDNVDLCSSILEWLGHEHHTADGVNDGNEGHFRIQSYQFDLIILDWDLPGISGVEICRNYRAKGGSTPILMLTGKGEITNKMEGLDAGADEAIPIKSSAKRICLRKYGVQRADARGRKINSSNSARTRLPAGIEIGGRTIILVGTPRGASGIYAEEAGSSTSSFGTSNFCL